MQCMNIPVKLVLKKKKKMEGRERRRERERGRAERGIERKKEKADIQGSGHGGCINSSYSSV